MEGNRSLKDMGGEEQVRRLIKAVIADEGSSSGAIWSELRSHRIDWLGIAVFSDGATLEVEYPGTGW